MTRLRSALKLGLAGLAIQLVVAMGGALWGIWKTDPQLGVAGERDGNLFQDTTRWGVLVYESPAFVRVHAWSNGGTFPEVPAYIPRFALDVSQLSRRAGRPFFTIVRVGWPFSSFEALATLDSATPAGLVARAVDGVLVGRPLNVTGLRVLPYGPLPWGILGNTVFWAVVVAGASRGCVAARRRWRRRRGRCPRCGHQIGPSIALLDRTCTECGEGLLDFNEGGSRLE